MCSMTLRPISFALALLATGAISTAGWAGGATNTALEDDAPSGNQLHVGTGVICDTQEEVTSFVRLMSEQDPGTALQAVNGKSSSPMACGMATVAFHAGKELGEVRTVKGSFNIVEIEIVAGAVDGSWQMVPRRTQFTAVAVKGIDI
jgi:hypothetical protein